MALAREDKERIVQEVKEVSASASSLVISDARGLKVSELTEIRKQGTESGVHIQVIKNSLAKLAFEGTDFGCTDEVLTGPSLFAFSYAEPGAAAKMLKTYAKNFEALDHIFTHFLVNATVHFLKPKNSALECHAVVDLS